jgi:hypothetical protein
MERRGNKKELMSMSCRSFVALMVLAGSIGLRLQAQATLPLVPGSPAPRTGEHLDVVLIYVSPSNVMPAILHRTAGRFVLSVTNSNTTTMNAGLVIEPEAVGALKLSASPLFKLGGKAVSDQSHRSAALLDLPVGEFDLKDATTGRILCKLVFD